MAGIPKVTPNYTSHKWGLKGGKEEKRAISYCTSAVLRCPGLAAGDCLGQIQPSSILGQSTQTTNDMISKKTDNKRKTLTSKRKTFSVSKSFAMHNRLQIPFLSFFSTLLGPWCQERTLNMSKLEHHHGAVKLQSLKMLISLNKAGAGSVVGGLCKQYCQVLSCILNNTWKKRAFMRQR